jgi:hypothetical protein
MKRVVVVLDEEDLIRLRRIITDRDKDEALKFIEDCLEAKVKEKELPHCVPVFDAGYNPRQADSFRKKE